MASTTEELAKEQEKALKLAKEDNKLKEAQNKGVAETLALIKNRNKELEAGIDVEKSLKTREKEVLGLGGDLKQKYEEAGDSLVSGVESFTMQAFGGPLGGIINSLTIGFVKRRRESAKQEKIKLKDEAKRKKDEIDYHKKLLRANAENILRGRIAKKQGKRITDLDQNILKGKESELVELTKNLDEAQKIRESKADEQKLVEEASASERKLKTDLGEKLETEPETTDVGEKVDTDKGTTGFLKSAEDLVDEKGDDVGVKKSKETGIEKESRVEEERESDMRWDRLFGYLDGILKALGGPGGPSGPKPTGGPDSKSMVTSILSHLAGTAGGISVVAMAKSFWKKHFSKLDDLSKLSDAELKAKKAQHIAELKKLEEGGKLSDKQLEKKRTKFNEEIKRLDQEHARRVEVHNKALSQADADYKKRLLELDDGHKTQTTQLQDAHNKKVQEINDAHNKKIEKIKVSNANAITEADKLHLENKRIIDEKYASNSKAHNEALKAADDAHIKKLAELDNLDTAQVNSHTKAITEAENLHTKNLEKLKVLQSEEIVKVEADAAKAKSALKTAANTNLEHSAKIATKALATAAPETKLATEAGTTALTKTGTKIVEEGSNIAVKSADEIAKAGAIGTKIASEGSILKTAQTAFQKIGGSFLLKTLGKLAAAPLSIAELGKDIFDVEKAKTAMKTDVAAKVAHEDVYAIAGSIIGAVIGIAGGPLGMAAGASLGNLIGEQIGATMDTVDVKKALDKAKGEIDIEKAALEEVLKNLEEQLAMPGISDKMKENLQLQIDINKRNLEGLNEESKKLEKFEAAVEKREAARESLNQLNANIKLLEKAFTQEGISGAEQQKIFDKITKLKEQRVGETATFVGAEAKAAAEGEAAGVEDVGAKVQLMGDRGMILDKVSDLSDIKIEKQIEKFGAFLKTGEKQFGQSSFGKKAITREAAQQTMAHLMAVKQIRTQSSEAYKKLLDKQEVTTKALAEEGQVETTVSYHQNRNRYEGNQLGPPTVTVGDVRYTWDGNVGQWINLASGDGKLRAGKYTLSLDQVPLREHGQRAKVTLPQEILERKRWGGGVNPDQPYLVGEVGPELMIPAGRGNIVSAEETVKMMGGYVNTLSGQNAQAGMTGGGLPGGFLNAPVTTDASTIIHNYPQQPQPNFGFPLPGDDRYNVIKISA